MGLAGYMAEKAPGICIAGHSPATPLRPLRRVRQAIAGFAGFQPLSPEYICSPLPGVYGPYGTRVPICDRRLPRLWLSIYAGCRVSNASSHIRAISPALRPLGIA